MTEFKNKITPEQILHLSNDLDLFLQDHGEDVDVEEGINDFCSKISKILVSAAERSGMISTMNVTQKNTRKSK